MKNRFLNVLTLGFIVANISVANAKIHTEKEIKDPTKTTVSKEKDSEAKVNYIGETKENGILFDINYANKNAQRFNLIVTNTQGDILFNQSFKDVNFHRTIMIKKDSDTEGTVNFSVRSNNSEICTKSFKIDTEAQYIRKIVVKSVK